MVLSALFFAGMSACFKAAASQANLWQTVFFRSAVALPMLVLIGWQRERTLKGNNSLFLISRSLTGFAGLCCGVYATARIPLGNATVLISTAPIFVALLSGFFSHEKTPQKVFYLLPFFTLGVALIVKPTLSFVLGMIFFREQPGLSTLGGALLIIICGYIATASFF